MDQSTVLLVVIAIAVVAVAIVVWALVRKARTKKLQGKFGPEYERTVRTAGDRGKAEDELEARRKRVEKFNLRSLSPEEQTRFARDWAATQTRFVDDPKGAVADGNRLVKELMQARGYPMADFEQRAADISVDHPRVVSNYRSAREIAARSEQGRATTEELRKAVVYYRDLFEELLETPQLVGVAR
jgi:FtsZ-interacting cell division protein ZipA